MVWIKTLTAVANIHVNLLFGTFKIHRNISARMTGRVEHRFFGGCQQLNTTVFIDGGFSIPNAHHIEDYLVFKLEVTRNLFELGRKVMGDWCAARVKPVAELTFLCTGNTSHFGCCSGTILNQSEGLENRIMQMGSDFCSLVRFCEFSLLLKPRHNSLTHRWGDEEDCPKKNGEETQCC